MMEQLFCVHWHITSTLDADVADNKSRQFYAWLIKIFLIRMIFLFRIGWSNYSVYIGTTTWPLERGQLIPHKLRSPVQIVNFCWRGSGLHKLWYPGIRDTSTWSKFGAHGEHGDVFLFSNLGALWFSENLIRYSLHVRLREVKNDFFLSNTLIYGISRDGSKNFNLCTCEHMILGQLRIRARQTKNAPLSTVGPNE